MQRARIRSAVVSAATAACVWAFPAVGSAQEAPSPASIDVNRARNAFASGGYQVGEAHTWTWTQPPFSSFRVEDATTGRVLMVVVYPSAQAADTARNAAEPRQAQDNSGSIGPYLVTGFGPSVWNGNVAIVQSSNSLLQRLYQAQVDRDNAVLEDTPEATDYARPAVTVDLDFRQALQDAGVVNL